MTVCRYHKNRSYIPYDKLIVDTIGEFPFISGLIVSGDTHLKKIGNYAGIAIVSPKEFIECARTSGIRPATTPA